MDTRVVQSGPAVEVASPPAIAIDGLTKRYGEDAVLDRVSFDVPENSIFGFRGLNGAGKTTTIKTLLGLARASSGKTCILGLDEETESLAIRRRIGYLARDPLLYPHMTARETLAFTSRFFYSGPDAGMRRRIDETLELVGLEDKADRPIEGFSGRERQRLVFQCQPHE